MDRRKSTCDYCGSDEGVVVVHPAAAVRAMRQGLKVGVFENGSRAAEDGKPSFYPVKFWVYDVGY